AHGRMDARRLVSRRDLQPQAADEEALAGNPAQPGGVRNRSRRAAGAACAPALPRSRGDHGLRHPPHGLNARCGSSGAGAWIDGRFIAAHRACGVPNERSRTMHATPPDRTLVTATLDLAAGDAAAQSPAAPDPPRAART